MFSIKNLLAILMMTSLFSISTMADNRMYSVEIDLKTKELRNKAASIIHLDQIRNDKGYAVVNKHDLLKLKSVFGKKVLNVKELNFVQNQIGTLDQYQFPKGDEAFHTYEEVVSALDNYKRDYSNIATVFEFGQTVEGRSIPAIKISGVKKFHKDQFVPAILFVGSHHAREHLSTEIPMLLIKYLLESYETNPEVKKLVDSREIYLVPMLNSDGAMYDIGNRKYKMWRKNRIQNDNRSFGVDLNRNYSFGWGTGGSSRSPNSDVYMGPKPFSEPETQAVKKFVENNANIRVLLSFHTFSELILYPWGGKNTGIGGEDQRVFEKMAQTMSKWNGYKPMQASGLYVASGDTCDWAYGEHNIYCFTFELSPKSMWSGGFYPGAKIIDKVFKANIKPSLYLIEKSADPKGVL
ncbi:M14 family metallopeptidase [Bacteriovoracaceae bacterium]|nr:M14 family metallopeptidase [Bacteriovoracaceae bacterium]